MAAAGGNGGGSNDARRGISSPRPKGRDNAKNTLCRNVTIFGHCKYENSGCAYNHDTSKANTANNTTKQRFNVDSPSFTPLQPATNGAISAVRSATISPKAVNATVFTPKAVKSLTPTPQSYPKDSSSDWSAHDFQDFVPQSYDPSQLVGYPNATASLINGYDPFNVQSTLSALPATNHQAQLNPYSTETSTLGGAAYFQNSNSFAQPLQYHAYFPLGPHRENLLAYQRTAHDFFISDHLRDDLQRKAEASRQILPSSTLPAQIEHFHSLVPLDTNNRPNASTFGYPSWVYKAVSSKDGFTYALRRLEGFRLTNDKAIKAIQPWKRINNGSICTIHDCFTTREFGDSSLILITDYHPLSKTLQETHLNQQGHRFHGGRQRYHDQSNLIPEQTIWGYVVQIASVLKVIHGTNLAARVLIPSKMIVTSKGRIRLTGCGIQDVTMYDTSRPVSDLQQEDLVNLGRLILSLVAPNHNTTTNPQKALDTLNRTYSERLREAVTWLLNPAPPPSTPTSPTGGAALGIKDIDTFLQGIAAQIVTVLDNTFHAEDTLMSSLSRELENGRLVRLLTKLGFINERPEYESTGGPHHPPGHPNHHSTNNQWSETGDRYYLKLFRDYVFHQVDSEGRPVVDLAHVLSCLNKLDAGSDERISLVSRDEQNVMVVSYRELKRGIEGAFLELSKGGGATGRRR
ncbi:PAB-dependent poly(A)-specific ribonuclease subunit PAN3 [Patellaria atrata CBS 101060]|uniref:PAN2-PAN3 deadenylation complex subunit PAN3 n=1 Tax=Patellaria atrata CBS 101060 TaxID=1346257 RepID=A0A9P4SIB0_9PEZI|nr:PAB-dependent poly(A)-specific ribonuclease subunit PAN3 [Patellaria atrata CBS 101060]